MLLYVGAVALRAVPVAVPVPAASRRLLRVYQALNVAAAAWPCSSPGPAARTCCCCRCGSWARSSAGRGPRCGWSRARPGAGHPEARTVGLGLVLIGGLLPARHRRSTAAGSAPAPHPLRVRRLPASRWRSRWPTASRRVHSEVDALRRDLERASRAHAELSRARRPVEANQLRAHGAGRGQPGQEPVPGQHEPRDPHAHERRDRHGAPAARDTPLSRRAAGVRGDSSTAPAARCCAIINDILDFSKIESGKLELERVDFDLRALVDEVVRLCAPLARGQGHRARRPSIAARRCRTRCAATPAGCARCWTTCVGNAVKFTEQGAVTLRVARRTRSDAGACSCASQVRDTGIGIPPEAQARLFQPFSQADALHHAPLRRHRPRPRHLQAPGRADGRPASASRSEAGEGSSFWFTAARRSARRATEAALRLAEPGDRAAVRAARRPAPRRPPRARAGGGGQPGQPEGGRRASWSGSATRRTWSRTAREAVAAVARQDVRRDPHGRPDARDGRLRGHARASAPCEGRARHTPIIALTASAHAGGPRALPGRGHGRLRREARRPRAARGRPPALGPRRARLARPPGRGAGCGADRARGKLDWDDHPRAARLHQRRVRARADRACSCATRAADGGPALRVSARATGEWQAIAHKLGAAAPPSGARG